MKRPKSINVAEVIFGQTERALFKCNGTEIAWMQDCVSAPYQLRYCTGSPSNLNYPAGNMDVYQIVDGKILTICAKSITSNERGEPTAITAVQRYFPPTVLAPAILPIYTTVVSETEGAYGWCAGDGYPDAPIEGKTFRHRVEVYHTGFTLQVDEQYWDGDERLYWKQFTYEIARNRLLSWYDQIALISVNRA